VSSSLPSQLFNRALTVHQKREGRPKAESLGSKPPRRKLIEFGLNFQANFPSTFFSSFYVHFSPDSSAFPPTRLFRPLQDSTCLPMAMERPPASSASSSSDDQTRISPSEAHPPSSNFSKHDQIFGSSGHGTTTTNGAGRSKTRLDHFSPDGELERTVSRQESRMTNTTQDPFQDDFDFEKHLKQILRKVDDKGVATREVGG